RRRPRRPDPGGPGGPGLGPAPAISPVEAAAIPAAAPDRPPATWRGTRHGAPPTHPPAPPGSARRPGQAFECQPRTRCPAAAGRRDRGQLRQVTAAPPTPGEGSGCGRGGVGGLEVLEETTVDPEGLVA